MKLISYPDRFSSVFADNVCRFGPINSQEPFEVSVEDDVCGLLGTKRFVGSEEVACSLSNYIRRRLNPQPLLLPQSAFTEAEGRNVRLTALWGEGQESPKMTFIVANTDHTECDPIGPKVQHRTIAPGEHDELLFVVGREKNICAKWELSTGERVNAYAKTSLRDGLWAWVVCADEMIARSARPEEVEWFTVEIVVETTHVMKATYTIVPPNPNHVRMAWLAPSGEICYHNFPRSIESSVATDTSEVELPSGTEVVAKSGWTQTRLESGVVSQQVMDHIVGIVTSPRVWQIVGGQAEPVVLLGSHLTLAGGSGRSLSLTIRPAKKVVYW